jgi:hypothetical protein
LTCRPAASATTIQQHQYHQQQVQGGKGKLLRPLTSGNIAAIEPYHHVPVTSSDPEKQSIVSGGIYVGQKQAAQIRPIVGDGITHLGKEGVCCDVLRVLSIQQVFNHGLITKILCIFMNFSTVHMK